MLRILTVLCLIGAILPASIGGESDLLDKFAKLKLMSSCLGEESTMNLKMKLKAATGKCMSNAVKDTMNDLKTMLNEVAVKYTQDQQFQDLPQYLLQKFQAFQAKHPIKETKTTVNSILSNVTCVLKEMKHIDANNQPNYAYFTEQINNLNVDEDLKRQFREAMATCQDIAKCIPVEKAPSPVMKQFGATISFMNCLFTKELNVCMKKDLKKYAPMIGFDDDQEFSEAQDVMNEITDMITQGMSFIM